VGGREEERVEKSFNSIGYPQRPNRTKLSSSTLVGLV